MGDDLVVYQRTLRVASEDLARIADQLTVRESELRAAVLGDGSPWPNGENNSLIGGAYTELAERVLENFRSTAKRCVGMAVGIATMADRQCDAAEESNAALTRDISA